MVLKNEFYVRPFQNCRRPRFDHHSAWNEFAVTLNHIIFLCECTVPVCLCVCASMYAEIGVDFCMSPHDRFSRWHVLSVQKDPTDYKVFRYCIYKGRYGSQKRLIESQGGGCYFLARHQCPRRPSWLCMVARFKKGLKRATDSWGIRLTFESQVFSYGFRRWWFLPSYGCLPFPAKPEL